MERAIWRNGLIGFLAVCSFAAAACSAREPAAVKEAETAARQTARPEQEEGTTEAPVEPATESEQRAFIDPVTGELVEPTEEQIRELEELEESGLGSEAAKGEVLPGSESGTAATVPPHLFPVNEANLGPDGEVADGDATLSPGGKMDEEAAKIGPGGEVAGEVTKIGPGGEVADEVVKIGPGEPEIDAETERLGPGGASDDPPPAEPSDQEETGESDETKDDPPDGEKKTESGEDGPTTPQARR